MRAPVAFSCRTLRRAALGATAAVAVLSCARLLPPAAAPDPGQVELVVYGGFARPADGAPLPRARVDVVVDATASTAGRRAAVRGAAEDTLRGLPADAEVALHALGHRGGQVCGPSERVAGPGDAASMEAALPPALAGAGAADGSLVAALRELEATLAANGVLRRSRVIVVSDLDDRCGGDLCAAAASLVAGGGWLELRVVGDAEPPACIAALRPSGAVPGRVASWFSPMAVPAYRVLAARGDVLATGRAGEGPVATAPGLVTLEVDLVPPERVGPFRVASGEHVRVRLLDFPGGFPPDRAWQVERDGDAFERSLPPPPPGARGEAVR